MSIAQTLTYSCDFCQATTQTTWSVLLHKGRVGELAAPYLPVGWRTIDGRELVCPAHTVTVTTGPTAEERG
jgi:hypothetical protein